MTHFWTRATGPENGPRRATKQREGFESVRLPAADSAGIAKMIGFSRSRSSSSSTSSSSSDGGCRLQEDADDDSPTLPTSTSLSSSSTSSSSTSSSSTSSSSTSSSSTSSSSSSANRPIWAHSLPKKSSSSLRSSSSGSRSPSPPSSESGSSSFASPTQFLWAHSLSGSSTFSSFQAPWAYSRGTIYPARCMLDYIYSIGRSPSPEPKKLGDTTYQYRDLNPRGTEIRLLAVLPQRSMQIEGTLFHAPLNGLPHYVAISYAWGDCDNTRLIKLDGHNFPITVSLWQALDRLRLDDTVVVIWADAVCINQKNPNERNHQVQSMAKIYTSAASVAIWLGPNYDNSHLAIDVILELVKVSQRNIDECKAIIQSSSWRDHLLALAELFDREYWFRLWTVQEVANGRKVDVYCGPANLPLTHLTQASLVLWRHNRHVRLEFPHVATKKKFPVPGRLGDSGPARYTAVGGYPGVDLWDAIEITKHHKCQDPRDKIYGVLGLLTSEERAQISVDYNLSKRKVYANAVEHILKTRKQLDIVCHSLQTCCQMDSMREDLPTWLPDFSLPDGRVRISGWDLFDASRGLPAVASVFAAQRKLKILAVSIDKIWDHSISLQQTTPLEGLLVTFLQWRAIAIGAYGFHEPAHQDFCGLLRADGDDVPPSLSARDWMREVYGTVDYLQQEWLAGTVTDERIRVLARDLTESERHPHNRVVAAMKYIVPGRRFCVTETGRFAIVAGSAHQGDCIYVPLGCSTPVVLRPDGQEYRLVGEAYVDGYMHGLAIDEVERGKKSCENVVLI